jgi:hypothetical protein
MGVSLKDWQFLRASILLISALYKDVAKPNELNLRWTPSIFFWVAIDMIYNYHCHRLIYVFKLTATKCYVDPFYHQLVDINYQNII